MSSNRQDSCAGHHAISSSDSASPPEPADGTSGASTAHPMTLGIRQEPYS